MTAALSNQISINNLDVNTTSNRTPLSKTQAASGALIFAPLYGHFARNIYQISTHLANEGFHNEILRIENLLDPSLPFSLSYKVLDFADYLAPMALTAVSVFIHEIVDHADLSDTTKKCLQIGTKLATGGILLAASLYNHHTATSFPMQMNADKFLAPYYAGVATSLLFI